MSNDVTFADLMAQFQAEMLAAAQAEMPEDSTVTQPKETQPMSNTIEAPVKNNHKFNVAFPLPEKITPIVGKNGHFEQRALALQSDEGLSFANTSKRRVRSKFVGYGAKPVAGTYFHNESNGYITEEFDFGGRRFRLDSQRNGRWGVFNQRWEAFAIVLTLA